MSELKVNKISPRSGTAVTLGDSGDTFTIPSGATLAIAGTVSGFTSAGIDDNATSVAITISSAEDVTFTEDIKLGDSKKALFGAGSDLQIYHDGSNSYVDDTGTGRLFLRGNDRVQIQKYTGEDMISCLADGAVNLYHNNAKKFETTATGATVTGNITATGNLTSLGIDDNADATAITIDSSEKVGILNTTPGSFHVSGNDLVVGNTTAGHGLTIVAENDSAGSINFADGSSSNASYRGKITYEHSNDSLAFHTGAAQRFKVASNGNFSIKTSADARTLNVFDTTPIIALYNSTTGTANNDGFQLQLSSDDGYLWNYESGGHTIFGTAGAERMRIDSSGNVYIGKTSGVLANVGHEFNAGSYASHTRDGDVTLYLNRKSSDGAIQEFRKDNTKVGSISCDASQNFTIQGKASSDFSLLFGTNKLNPKNYAGTGAKDNAVDLGDNDDRWKDIYLGGGAFIGGTGTANKLDDYEEGTFTPTIALGITSVGYSSRFGRYTKIGNTVSFSFNIQTNAGTLNSSRLKFGGLPFNVTGSVRGFAVFNYVDGDFINSKTNNLPTLVFEPNPTIETYFTDGTQFLGTDLGNAVGQNIYIGGVYESV